LSERSRYAVETVYSLETVNKERQNWWGERVKETLDYKKDEYENKEFQELKTIVDKLK